MGTNKWHGQKWKSERAGYHFPRPGWGGIGQRGIMQEVNRGSIRTESPSSQYGSYSLPGQMERTCWILEKPQGCRGPQKTSPFCGAAHHPIVIISFYEGDGEGFASSSSHGPILRRH
ncbi:hypothetical protein H112_00612, partial [Trichophyton rubrum D6]